MDDYPIQIVHLVLPSFAIRVYVAIRELLQVKSWWVSDSLANLPSKDVESLNVDYQDARCLAHG